MTATDIEHGTSLPPFGGVDVSPIAHTIGAGLLVARLHHLDKLASLRRCTTRQLTANAPAISLAARTAV
ncbi:MAG: hypothetical protein ACKVWR_07300 [Acidimicrobiales bacterium]